jgi:hypothetical protein
MGKRDPRVDTDIMNAADAKARAGFAALSPSHRRERKA